MPQAEIAGKTPRKSTKIPKRYVDCHFHSYKIMNPSQERAFKYASKLAMEYPAIERGLLFMGTVGVGKTHLAVSILKGFNRTRIFLSVLRIRRAS